MRRRVVLALLAIAAVATPFGDVGAAVAVGGTPPDTGPVLLGYGEAYRSSSGDERTHQGADLAADVGSVVASLADGVVRFAGRVPAAEGGTCFAITLETPDGLSVSTMPLQECWVAAGDVVAVGDPLGGLCGTGDASCPDTHLHVGVRRGTAYLDPLSFLPIGAPSARAEAPRKTAESVADVSAMPVAPRVATDAEGSRVPATARSSGGAAVSGDRPTERPPTRSPSAAGRDPSGDEAKSRRGEARVPSSRGSSATSPRDAEANSAAAAHPEAAPGNGGAPGVGSADAASGGLPSRLVDVAVVVMMVIAAAALPVARGHTRPLRAALAGIATRRPVGARVPRQERKDP